MHRIAARFIMPWFTAQTGSLWCATYQLCGRTVDTSAGHDLQWSYHRATVPEKQHTKECS